MDLSWTGELMRPLHPHGEHRAPSSEAALRPAASPLRMSATMRLGIVALPILALWILVGFATDFWR